MIAAMKRIQKPAWEDCNDGSVPTAKLELDRSKVVFAISLTAYRGSIRVECFPRKPCDSQSASSLSRLHTKSRTLHGNVLVGVQWVIKDNNRSSPSETV